MSDLRFLLLLVLVLVIVAIIGTGLIVSSADPVEGVTETFINHLVEFNHNGMPCLALEDHYLSGITCDWSQYNGR